MPVRHGISAITFYCHRQEGVGFLARAAQQQAQKQAAGEKESDAEGNETHGYEYIRVFSGLQPNLHIYCTEPAFLLFLSFQNQ